MLETSYVRISELGESDTRLRGDTPSPPNLESGVEPKELLDTPETELINSEVSQTPDSTLGQGSDLTPPTHHKQYSPSKSGPPNICDLMYV